MSKSKAQITLKKYENIIAVIPEYCSGPGWYNSILWVHIADGNTGKYRTEAIQPSEQNEVQRALFKSAEALNHALLSSISSVVV